MGTGQLFIVGTGLRFPEHLTLEAMEVLEASERIFTLLGTSQIAQLPEPLSVKCISIWDCYREDRCRPETYDEVINIVREGITTEDNTSWLTFGNPRVFDSVTEGLIEGAISSGTEVVVVPAISALDTILIDVGYDPANGLQVYDATCLVLYQVPLLNSIGLILFQPSVFGSIYPRMHEDSPLPDFSPLVKHLLQYYPIDHQVIFVRSPESLDERPSLKTYTVGSLSSVGGGHLNGSSLFIPPSSEQEVDASFLRAMEGYHGLSSVDSIGNKGA